MLAKVVGTIMAPYLLKLLVGVADTLLSLVSEKARSRKRVRRINSTNKEIKESLDKAVREPFE